MKNCTRLIALLLAFVFCSACLTGKTPGQKLTSVYYDIETRRMQDKNTFSDKLVMRTTYSTMVFGSIFVYPEAAMTLHRCVHNNTRDLRLPNNYFKKSDYIQKQIKNKKPGTYGPFYLQQTQDTRLSYTFNGYYIDIALAQHGKKKIKVYQLIDFSHQTTRHKRPLHKRGVTTTFYMGKFMTFKMSDTLIFVVSECKPFLAYTEWQE